MSERTRAILLAAVVALGAVTGVAATGVAAADGGLEVAVDDADGEPTVTVTENDTAVENATVVVSVVDDGDENASYAGTGEYETDANGTVDLPAAKEDVTVAVTAAAGDDTASTTVDLEAPDGLELDVENAESEPVVTVTNDDDPVENASVNVTAVDENASYAGAGEYETDANGTVTLPAAEEDVTVNVTAEYDNESASETVDIEAPDGLEVAVDDTDGEPVVTVTDNGTAVENASVTVTTVDENATYAGAGEYETDEDGTVGLPAAEENVTVEVTAAYGGESVSTTVDLTVGDEDEAEGQPFGQLVREFIEDIEDREGGIGGAVSDFVTENNPGNAPDHAGGPGGPDDADDGDDAENETDAPGNAPDHAGPDGEDDDERGPPSDADPDREEDDDAEETEGDAEDDDADEEGEDADEDEEDEESAEDEEDEESEEDEAEDDADEEETEADEDADEDEADEEETEADEDADEDEADEEETEADEDADEDEADEEADDDDGEGGPPDHAGGPGGN
ncbi:DNA primase [Halorubrum ezzemoulense]|uniref:DNA primase n=1 Tax=Halorubrum ezzemoulense TaxID=337243 RepID=A0A256IUT9_HALEZ|nr:DNA primase [Halorubrum ezzemoulense]OYR60339.1 DNA primase [Halorubrum ezzemoulense]